MNIEEILSKMSGVGKPQRKFLAIVLVVFIYLRGKANFRNLSRHSELSEKTYSRWFRRDFDFAEFNRRSLADVIENANEIVAVVDCSFCEKSGKQTYGLDKFYNSKHNKAEKGLEISTLALVDIKYNTAYNLSTRQTPELDNEDETRVDAYIEHLRQDRQAIPEKVKYLLTDGYYSKIKFINGVVDMRLDQIGKLRHDSNLRWLYNGEQKSRGRHKCYDGKVEFDNLARFEFVDTVNEVQVYTSVVNSIQFKRNIRIVYLLKQEGNKMHTALLFSTDTELAALDIYRFYKARFQIEFLFRDAKQFTGFSDCQARCQSSLHFHFNISMTALNLIKLEDRQHAFDGERNSISILSWKIRKFNEHLLQTFSSILGLDFSSIKSHPSFEPLCNYGVVM